MPCASGIQGSQIDDSSSWRKWNYVFSTVQRRWLLLFYCRLHLSLSFHKTVADRFVRLYFVVKTRLPFYFNWRQPWIFPSFCFLIIGCSKLPIHRACLFCILPETASWESNVYVGKMLVFFLKILFSHWYELPVSDKALPKSVSVIKIREWCVCCFEIGILLDGCHFT